VLPGIYLRRSISTTNWKELSSTNDKICAEYFLHYGKNKERKELKQKMGMLSINI
jgi:hypothetical protein